MASNDYHYLTHWRVPGSVAEVAAILGNARDLPRWWPSVYLDVRELEPGGADGLGKVVSLYTKGWLPYTLRWQFQVVEVRHPQTFTLEAWGDLTGRGVWTLAQSGAAVAVTYDWKVRGDKPLFRYFSFLLKPLFGANHHWAMRQGEISLKLELARRRAPNREALVRLPAPPGPTFSWLTASGRAWETIRSSSRT